MKRKYLFNCVFVVLLIMVIALPGVAYAAGNPTVVLDGRVRLYDQQPFIESGRTLVPMRGIFENLGAHVQWEPETTTVTASKGDMEIILVIGKQSALVNGQSVSLDVPPRIVNDRTFVPLRFVSEAMGADVEWEPVTRTIYINSGAATDEVTPVMKTVQQVAEESDSVVMITTFDSAGRKLAAGSGFAVGTDVVLTNYHVIDGAYKAAIWLEDGSTADVVGVIDYDAGRDVAFLKVSRKGLRPVQMGNSGRLSVGEQVVAIGSPVGLNNTVSDGIISSLNRLINGFSYIQTSAPISPGSSGGALFNMKGEVIGITTAMFSGGQNLNLAIPSDEVKGMVTDGVYKPLPIDNVSEAPLSYNDFVGKLLDDMGKATISSYEVLFDGAWAVDSDDETTVLMELTLDSENYLNLLKGIEKGGEDEFKQWLADIISYTEEFFPNKRVLGEVKFRGIFDNYPDSFPADSITASPNGAGWWVSYRVIYFYDDAEWVYFEWNT